MAATSRNVWFIFLPKGSHVLIFPSWIAENGWWTLPSASSLKYCLPDQCRFCLLNNRLPINRPLTDGAAASSQDKSQREKSQYLVCVSPTTLCVWACYGYCKKSQLMLWKHLVYFHPVASPLFNGNADSEITVIKISLLTLFREDTILNGKPLAANPSQFWKILCLVCIYTRTIIS